MIRVREKLVTFRVGGQEKAKAPDMMLKWMLKSATKALLVREMKAEFGQCGAQRAAGKSSLGSDIDSCTAVNVCHTCEFSSFLLIRSEAVKQSIPIGPHHKTNQMGASWPF